MTTLETTITKKMICDKVYFKISPLGLTRGEDIIASAAPQDKQCFEAFKVMITETE